MGRKLKIGLEAATGAIDRFRVTVGNDIVISGNGTQKPVWGGQIADTNVPVKVQATGSANASFKVSLDLEGVLKNQSLEISLVDGHSELHIVF